MMHIHTVLYRKCVMSYQEGGYIRESLSTPWLYHNSLVISGTYRSMVINGYCLNVGQSCGRPWMIIIIVTMSHNSIVMDVNDWLFMSSATLPMDYVTDRLHIKCSIPTNAALIWSPDFVTCPSTYCVGHATMDVHGRQWVLSQYQTIVWTSTIVTMIVTIDVHGHQLSLSPCQTIMWTSTIV